MVPVFRLDIQGLASFPAPMTVIKHLSSSLKSFQVEEVEIEDITRKMRRILVCSGIPSKAGLRENRVLVRFQIHTDIGLLKSKFPNGKLLGQVKLTPEIPLYVYREEKV